MHAFFWITRIIYLYLYETSGLPQYQFHKKPQTNVKKFQLSTITQQNKDTIRISFPLFCPFPAVQVVQSPVNQQNGARSSSCQWAEGFSNRGPFCCEESCRWIYHHNQRHHNIDKPADLHALMHECDSYNNIFRPNKKIMEQNSSSLLNCWHITVLF